MTAPTPQPHPRRLGVTSIAFMIIAASAPLTAIAGGTPTSFAVSGLTAVPASYVLLAVLFAVFAFGYSAMARHVSNAGAFYAYISRGLGRPFGVGSAISAVISYGAMQTGIFAMLGFTVADWLTTRFGLVTPWWLWVIVAVVIVGVLGVFRVDFSAKVIGVIVALEFVVVAVFDVIALTVAPEGHSLEPLNPASLFVPGIGVLLAFSVAAFMGFESAAIYANEAKDPKRTIGRATFLAVIVIGCFYAFSAWAFALGVGPSKVISESQDLGPALMFTFLGQHTPTLFMDIANVLFITSLFAAVMSFHNAVARYIGELGREQVLPPVFGHRTKHGTPIVGSLTQSGIAAVVTAGFIAADPGQDPLFPVLTMFTWLTNTGALGLILLMVLVSAAVIAFFNRDARGIGAWTRLVAPAISGAALTVVFVLVLANFDLMLGQSEPNALTFLLPAMVVVPGAVGVVYAMWLRQARPAKYALIAADLPGKTEAVRVSENIEA